jgi:hypothetical protein
MTMMTCCICDGPIQPAGDWTTGNDAWPVAAGRCCNHCDLSVVVPARLAAARRPRGNFYVVYHDPSDTWQLCMRSGMPCMSRQCLDTVLEVCLRTERAKPSKGFAWPLDVMHVTNDDVPGVWSGVLEADGSWK